MKLNRAAVPGLIALIIFGAAFGYVEAAVVRYLHLALALTSNQISEPYRMVLNLGFIAFIRPLHPALISATVSRVEAFREAATIVMLACIAFVASRRPLERLGAFMVAFATWDIMYYVFLSLLTGWPTGLWSRDIYFLIPVPWVGPVLTPVVISSALFIVGSWLFISTPQHRTQASKLPHRHKIP